MMYATQRCPSIPLCDHLRPHYDQAHCSKPWPVLPHRACHPRQTASVGAIVRRTRSTRETSGASFSAIAFPRHVVSRRHLSHSAVPVRQRESQLPQEVPDAPQDDDVVEVLPCVREQPSKSSIKVHFDEDERDRLSDCETEIGSCHGDVLSSPPWLPQQNLRESPHHVRPGPTQLIDLSPSERTALRQIKTRSMPFAPRATELTSLATPVCDRSGKTRSLFIFRNESLASSPQTSSPDSTSALLSLEHKDHSDAQPPPPKLQPSPTFTRTRAIKFGLQTRPVHEQSLQ
jgi:hypothetical protein